MNQTRDFFHPKDAVPADLFPLDYINNDIVKNLVMYAVDGFLYLYDKDEMRYLSRDGEAAWAFTSVDQLRNLLRDQRRSGINISAAKMPMRAFVARRQHGNFPLAA